MSNLNSPFYCHLSFKKHTSWVMNMICNLPACMCAVIPAPFFYFGFHQSKTHRRNSNLTAAPQIPQTPTYDAPNPPCAPPRVPSILLYAPSKNPGMLKLQCAEQDCGKALPPSNSVFALLIFFFSSFSATVLDEFGHGLMLSVKQPPALICIDNKGD